ncbi:hypothetical protein AYK24_08290 [Thermoplasmatales archaeon SG8-52-4]|nr:MAG: hypothetical protein AYK24_08290 [Thermoplasmatales archaeon SG8-52-4]
MTKKVCKNVNLFIYLLIIFSLISSSSLSMGLNYFSMTEDFDILNKNYDQTSKNSNGLAPKKSNNIQTKTKLPMFLTGNFKNNNTPMLYTSFETMYCYIANSSIYNEGTCYFDIDDPGNIFYQNDTDSDNFLSAGTGISGMFVACENSTGALWEIDPYSWVMRYIGGGGIGLNGLSHNGVCRRLYGASGTSLYEIHPLTGDQEYIGDFGSNVNEMIGISFDADGVLYGWDLGDRLWTIDTETGEATEVGTLGIDLNYAQDGGFSYDTDTLYLTAYTISPYEGSYFYECDEDTGECTLIGQIEGNSQITASTASLGWFVLPNDVGIKAIVKPKDGYANENMEVVVLIKNHGNNTLIDIPASVVIYKDGSIEDYNETINIEKINKGETLQVEFPKWTPTDWQSVKNDYINYKINASATVWLDPTPHNNYKEKWFKLYFPWFNDIGIKRINSPSKNGPGKTYPVNTTIKNFGQYENCCISVNISIGKPIILDTLLSEKNWSEVPPQGWHDDHKDIGPEYGWEKSYSSNSGGSSPEVCLSYDKALENNYFYSHSIDTSNYDFFNLKFKSYIDHYSGQGLYSLEAGYSLDGETWYVVWHDEPWFSRKYDIEVPIMGGFETLYIGFWLKGDPYYFNNWYIDDVELLLMSVDEEYTDSDHINDYISPGEELIIEFKEWTPEFLHYETTGKKDYIITSFIEIDGDENPANDIDIEIFSLDFFHDVGISKITSPTGGRPHYSLVYWNNGNPDGRYALPGSKYNGYSNILIDDFYVTEDSYFITGQVHFIWNNGYTSNLKKINVYFFKDENLCNPSLEEYPEPEYSWETDDFNEYTTGNYFFNRPEIIVDFYLYEYIIIPKGKWYIGIQPVGIIDDLAYILTAKSKECMVMADLPYWDYQRWTSSEKLWWEELDLSWGLSLIYTSRAIWANAFIKPGLQDINAIVENYGTFPKYNITCYAEIWEFITDPINGTKVYTDEIANINLPIPLEGAETLEFDEFNFTKEGRYSLRIELPANPDDKQNNNKKYWGIGVDYTNPESDYPPVLDPPNPTGKNGWYIDNVQVTLTATDPESNRVSSGVKEIKYSINGGIEHLINGSMGSFEISEEGNDILIEYWAVDWVGNVETPKKSFIIDIDKTEPEVSISYEVLGWSPLEGWEFQFTAVATDDISGMHLVEFYLNNQLQDTVIGSGAEYVWTLYYNPLPNAIFRATAFDKAGLFDSDEVINPDTKVNSYSKNIQLFIKHNIFEGYLLRHIFAKFPVFKQLFRSI